MRRERTIAFYDSRKDAKGAKKEREKDKVFLRSWRPFDFAQDTLGGRRNILIFLC